MNNIEPKVTKKKLITCKQCNKSYTDSSHLKRHMRASHENNIFNCNDCEKQFKTKDNLSIHVKNVHNEKKSHQCSLCNKVYGYAISLQSHIAVVHEGKRIQCSECEEKFAAKRDMKSHIRKKHR